MARRKNSNLALYLALAALFGPKKAIDWYLWLMGIAIGVWFYAMFIM